MNAGDKQVKFTFAVDQRSLGAAKQAIASLTSEVKKLVETMARAGQGVSLGGRHWLGGVSSSRPAQSRRSSPRSRAAALTQGIAADAKALSGPRASTDALGQITRAMRSNFSGQISEIEKLKRELAGLESQYERLKDVAGARPGSPNARRAESAMIGNELAVAASRARSRGTWTSAGLPGLRRLAVRRTQTAAKKKPGFFGGMWDRVYATKAAEGNPFEGGLSGMALRALGIGGSPAA
jgi:hypothetical protein